MGVCERLPCDILSELMLCLLWQAFLGELVAAAVFIYVLFATIVSPRYAQLTTTA